MKKFSFVAAVTLLAVAVYAIAFVLNLSPPESDGIWAAFHGFNFQEIAILCGAAGLGLVINGRDVEKITSLEDLQEMRNGIVDEIGKLRDKYNSRADESTGQTGKFEGEEREQWKTLNDQIKAIDERMNALRDGAEMERRWNEINKRDNNPGQGRPGSQQRGDINNPDGNRGVTEETRAIALQAWMRHQSGMELNDEHRDAVEALNVNLNVRQLNLRMRTSTQQLARMRREAGQVHRTQRATIYSRAMSTSTGTGGEFIPTGFMNVLEQNLLAYGGIREVCDIWRTDSGNEVPWPTSSDQDEGEWIGESTTVADDAQPATGNVLFGAHKISSKAILVPTELLEDSAFDLASWLPEVIGHRLGRGINRAATTSPTSQVDRPDGVVELSTLGATAAAAGALTFQDLTRLEHSVDPNYRVNARYMLHDGAIELLRLLVDGDGKPLWQPGLALGIPDRINGRQFQINQHMDNTFASTTKPILFGDFMKYKLREVRSIRLYHLLERFRDKDQDAFLAFMRVDGKLVDAGAGAIRHLLMP